MKQLLLLAAMLIFPALSFANCTTHLRLLADDLKDVTLSDAQTQSLASILMHARRNCWVQREKEAMEHIAKARSVAGLKPRASEFDWENVPLESLEPAAPRHAPQTGAAGASTQK